MVYDFEKIARYNRKYGRVIYEDANGQVIFQSCSLPKDGDVKIAGPDEYGIRHVYTRDGSLRCCIKTYPSKEAFMNEILEKTAKLEKEELLAAVMETFGIW